MRYPIVEAITGLLSLVVVWHFGLSAATAGALLFIVTGPGLLATPLLLARDRQAAGRDLRQRQQEQPGRVQLQVPPRVVGDDLRAGRLIRLLADYEVMEAAIEEMAAHIDDPEEFITHDLAFHSALAAATHNDLFGVLLNAISGFWSEAALLAYQAPGAAEDSLNYHRDILRHVKARDPEKARRAMCEHVRYSQEQAKAASAR